METPNDNSVFVNVPNLKSNEIAISSILKDMDSFLLSNLKPPWPELKRQGKMTHWRTLRWIAFHALQHTRLILKPIKSQPQERYHIGRKTHQVSLESKSISNGLDVSGLSNDNPRVAQLEQQFRNITSKFKRLLRFISPKQMDTYNNYKAYLVQQAFDMNKTSTNQLKQSGASLPPLMHSKIPCLDRITYLTRQKMLGTQTESLAMVLGSSRGS